MSVGVLLSNRAWPLLVQAYADFDSYQSWTNRGQLAHVERSRSLTVALSTVFGGGLARLRSWQQRGRPHPVSVAAVVLETVAAPTLIVWQRRIASR